MGDKIEGVRIGTRPCSVMRKVSRRERRPCMTSNPTLTSAQRRQAIRSLPRTENFSNLTTVPHDIEAPHLDLLRLALCRTSREDSSQKHHFHRKAEHYVQHASTARSGRMRRLSMTESPLKRPLPPCVAFNSQSNCDASVAHDARSFCSNSFDLLQTGSFDSISSGPLHRSRSVEGFELWERQQSKHQQQKKLWSGDRRKAQRVLTRSLSFDDDNVPMHSHAPGWRYTMTLL